MPFRFSRKPLALPLVRVFTSSPQLSFSVLSLPTRGVCFPICFGGVANCYELETQSSRQKGQMSICPLGLYSQVLDGLKPMMSVSQEPEGGNPFIKVGFSSPHPTPDVSWYIHHRPNSQSSYNSTYIPSSATNIDPSKCTMGILPSGSFVWSFRNYPKKQSENQPVLG